MSIASLDPREKISDAEIVTDLAHHLILGRQDPSDPDTAIEYLLSLDLYRPTVVCKHYIAALDECGQICISREISKRVA